VPPGLKPHLYRRINAGLKACSTHTQVVTFSSSFCSSRANEVMETCARRERKIPAGMTDMKVTSQSRMPQLTARLLRTPSSAIVFERKTYFIAVMVANCDPPPTTGSCATPPATLKPISKVTEGTAKCNSGLG